MGGARNFTHYATKEILAFLNRRQVSTWFIIDRDERTIEDIAELRNKLGDSANLIALERRQIENYLLEPRALADFINYKSRIGGIKRDQSQIDAARVATALSEVADQLRDITIERWVERDLCRPAYFIKSQVRDESSGRSLSDRIAIEIDRMIEELKQRKDLITQSREKFVEEINSNWEERRLHLVPGDMLLDETCKKFGVRFSKERDGGQLAAMMQIDEISNEFRSILRRIAGSS